MPSTTSRVVSRPFASSTVITPSLPTLSIASAMMPPMVASLFAEIVPTWAISFWSFVGFERLFSSAITCCTALSMPRLIDIGSWPAATIFAPSTKMERARTVAVVVPSPATSEVFEATSFTICAPMFSNLSSSSTSLATVTPSFVMLGAPNDFSSTTFRPFGPSVTVTASARMFTPWRTFSLASLPNLTIFAAICDLPPTRFASAFQNAEDVVLAQDQVLLALDLDLGAGVLPEQDAVTGLHVEWPDLAVLVDLALADPDHLALLGLLLRGVRDDDPTLRLLLFLDTPDDHAVLQWTDLHRAPSPFVPLREPDLLGNSTGSARARAGPAKARAM